MGRSGCAAGQAEARRDLTSARARAGIVGVGVGVQAHPVASQSVWRRTSAVGRPDEVLDHRLGAVGRHRLGVGPGRLHTRRHAQPLIGHEHRRPDPFGRRDGHLRSGRRPTSRRTPRRPSGMYVGVGDGRSEPACRLGENEVSAFVSAGVVHAFEAA